jgi:butyryl-CoA dehydrogenase
VSLAQQGKLEEFLADANLFMELSGNLVLGWQWLKQGVIAVKELEKQPNSTFYASKVETMKYYFTYELPKCKGLMDVLINEELITLPKEEEHLI